MSITTILFDLDGTLLPMDQEVFVKAYFKGLCQKLAPHGYRPDELIAAVWAGTKAMVTNDGSISNEEAFWNRFAELLGEGIRQYHGLLEEFYQNEFQSVRQVCGFDPMAAEAVRRLKNAGYRVVLATNPIFPAVATHSRIAWAGLSPDEFTLVTTYENAHYCKPNPAYYREILQAISATPDQCLMVGNDVGEDLLPTAALGMQTYLLPACLICPETADSSGYPQGSLQDLLTMLGA